MIAAVPAVVILDSAGEVFLLIIFACYLNASYDDADNHNDNDDGVVIFLLYFTDVLYG